VKNWNNTLSAHLQWQRSSGLYMTSVQLQKPILHCCRLLIYTQLITVEAYNSDRLHRSLTAQRCYVQLLTKLKFWYWEIARAFFHLWTICYRNEEIWLYWSRWPNSSGCAKLLCPFHSSTKVLSPAVDVIPRPTLLLYDM